MNAGKISEDGSVNLSFSHASDYVIVIGENMTPAKASSTPAATATAKKAAKTGDNNNVILFSTLLVLGFAGVMVAVKKNRKIG